MSGFTHFDPEGNVHMVDVSPKGETVRTACAVGRITVGEEIFRAIESQSVKKGDVLAVAQIAGIQAAKRTWELIPLCHALQLTHVGVEFALLEEDFAVECRCSARCVGRTGVEMEALTGVQVALLTIYDMCKAMSHDMVIGPTCLLEKSGGKSGTYQRG